MAIPLDYDGNRYSGDEFLDALALLTRGHHATVLHAIASGAGFMPAIREATGYAIDEMSLISVLKQLMYCGAVARSVHSGPPLRVEYRLTEAGRTLDALIVSAQAWTERWAYAPAAPPAERPALD